MQKADLDVKAKFIRGFSDKTRLQILECIQENEKTVTQIVENIKGNQSNISQHLACLKECGIVTSRQEGKYIFYGLRDIQVKELLHMFDQVLSHIHVEVANCERNDECLK
jgi:DNA-binding transcriptional ArsR family regulator